MQSFSRNLLSSSDSGSVAVGVESVQQQSCVQPKPTVDADFILFFSFVGVILFAYLDDISILLNKKYIAIKVVCQYSFSDCSPHLTHHLSPSEESASPSLRHSLGSLWKLKVELYLDFFFFCLSS